MFLFLFTSEHLDAKMIVFGCGVCQQKFRENSECREHFKIHGRILSHCIHFASSFYFHIISSGRLNSRSTLHRYLSKILAKSCQDLGKILAKILPRYCKELQDVMIRSYQQSPRKILL